MFKWFVKPFTVSQKKQRDVWFYRDFAEFTGGHLKHAHYYQNVQALKGYQANIVFSRKALSEHERSDRAYLWPYIKSGVVDWKPVEGDLLFLAGLDWHYLLSKGGIGLSLPKINLIQHVRHADPQTDLYGFLTQKAIRICVSQEVADAISATQKVNGPVITIPNGVDVSQISAAELNIRCEDANKRQKVLIVGYKMPAIAQQVADELGRLGIGYQLVNSLLERRQFLAAISNHSIVVCCPSITEGFYLPAIEVMAAGSILIVPDCVGNRSFCIEGDTCFMPDYTASQMVQAVLNALSLTEPQRKKMLSSALSKASEYTLEKERAAFYSVLKNVDQIW